MIFMLYLQILFIFPPKKIYIKKDTTRFLTAAMSS